MKVSNARRFSEALGSWLHFDFSESSFKAANPFEVGVGYFGDFANKIEQQSLQNGSSTDPDASASFNLAADSTQGAI